MIKIIGGILILVVCYLIARELKKAEENDRAREARARRERIEREYPVNTETNGR